MADTAGILALMRHAANRLADEEASVRLAFAAKWIQAEEKHVGSHAVIAVDQQAWSYVAASTYAQTVLRMVAKFMTDTTAVEDVDDG